MGDLLTCNLSSSVVIKHSGSKISMFLKLLLTALVPGTLYFCWITLCWISCILNAILHIYLFVKFTWLPISHSMILGSILTDVISLPDYCCYHYSSSLFSFHVPNCSLHSPQSKTLSCFLLLDKMLYTMLYILIFSSFLQSSSPFC